MAPWIAVALASAINLIACGVAYGALLGRLRMIEYRIGQLEGALKVMGFKFILSPQDASV